MRLPLPEPAKVWLCLLAQIKALVQPDPLTAIVSAASKYPKEQWGFQGIVFLFCSHHSWALSRICMIFLMEKKCLPFTSCRIVSLYPAPRSYVLEADFQPATRSRFLPDSQFFRLQPAFITGMDSPTTPDTLCELHISFLIKYRA